MRDLTQQLADQFGITEADRQRLLPSGQTTYVTSRVGWAKTYLKKSGLIDSPSRGFVRITDEGRKVLSENPQKIDTEFLKRFQPFVEFYNQSKVEVPPVESDDKDTRTPDEILEASYQDLRTALADDLLEQVKSCSPRFFERLVVDLLVAMGYGGSLADAGQAIGRTGDGGIDGIIKEDKLGLDVVCVQAEEYVSRIERKIVLIDGRQLAQLMIDHDIGVTTARNYIVKRLDSDYFVEEEA